MQNKFFSTDKLSDSVTRIHGMGGELCYLIEGNERALLIDGLTGVGSLKAFVRELTELPVMMAATHGHIDHVGAAWEYGEVFINPDDIALMYTPHHSEPAGRLGFASAPSFTGEPKRTVPTLADVPAPRPVKTYPIYEGDIFDLGGIQIEVIQVPGHTQGTVVFLDRAARVVYSGDACNANTLLCLPGSTTIEEYKESLLHFKTFQKDFDVMYGGHGAAAVPNTIIDDGIAMCERILAGTDESVETPAIDGGTAFLGSARGTNYFPVCGGLCNIMYAKDMIHKRPHPVIKDAPNLYR
ncbi:MAG: MBL fold metallo-hydrolase [Oscillospiraceae bacterium]|nr:MBL fold metallo-hydrolase [Oscillospiraceae bacterium]